MVKNILLFLVVIEMITSCNFKENKDIQTQNHKIPMEKVELPISKTKVGLGLIHFNLNEAIPFYKTENEAIPYDTLVITEKKSDTDKGIALFKTQLLGSKLKPYLMAEGDSDEQAKSNINHGLIRFLPQLIFRVIEKSKNGVTVLINEETYETSFIKIDAKNDYRITSDSDYYEPNFVSTEIVNWFFYETWEQVLVRAWDIYYNENQPFYDQPNGKIISTTKTFNQIDSVNGNWARMVERYNEDKTNFGWIKWKKNDSLNVYITLNGGYE